MTAKKKSSVRKKNIRKKPALLTGQKLKILLASIFLLVFVAVCLFTLVVLRESYFSPRGEFAYEEKPLPQIQPEPAPKQPIYGYQQILQVIENELLSGRDSEGWKKLSNEGEVQRLQVFGDYPPADRLTDLASQLTATGAPVQLDLQPRKGQINLFWQGELRLNLRYRVPLEVKSSRPKIAVIMDDMGRSLKTFETLLELDLLITPAILPESEKATRAARLLQRAGREYMIHMPMQPKSYPRANPGPNALLLGQTEQEIRQLVRRYIDLVPGAVGGNNHMGSRYTEEREPMRIVLDELRQSGQFFIDSKTIAGSVAYDEARKMGLPTAVRNIFLDNEEDVGYIRRQIREMVRLSDVKGEVIAICHPYPETIEAFRQELAWLKQQQIDFVPASALTRMY